MVDLKDYIKSGDFCTVTETTFLHDKVKTNDIVWIAGVKAFPMSEDPYNQRLLMLVHLVLDGHIQVGKELYVMDPVGLEKVDMVKASELNAQMDKDFSTTIDTSN